jgi:phosphatidylglycerophosphate synthase
MSDAPREKTFLLAPAEGRVLNWLAERMPARVRPDHMTILGVVAALGVGAAYWLSGRDPAWLWVAGGLLVVHWLGDSLDGTLARVRRIERPRYGYFLDHLVDAGATIAIGAGLGLSPYMGLATASRSSSPTWRCRSTPTSRPRCSASSRSATGASGRPKPASA